MTETSEQQRAFNQIAHDVNERLGYMVYSEMGGFSTEGDAVFLRFYLTHLEDWLRKMWLVVGKNEETYE